MNSIPSGSIMVAADGSAEADRAVTWAAEQAFLERRRLVVLSAAVEINSHSAVDLAVRHRPGLDVGCIAVVGDPSSAIVDHTSNAHMVVLGSRGRGRVSSRTLGSVSASVTRHATCPVVVCRPGSDLKVKNGVVVGVDGTRESLPVIDFAFRQAALRGQPLTVLHCHGDGPEDELALEASRLALAESIAGFREDYPEVHTTIRVARGTAGDSLAAVADRYNIVVIGRHPVESLARRVASATATSVLERCHTIVAVVPEAASHG